MTGRALVAPGARARQHPSHASAPEPVAKRPLGLGGFHDSVERDAQVYDLDPSDRRLGVKNQPELAAGHGGRHMGGKRDPAHCAGVRVQSRGNIDRDAQGVDRVHSANGSRGRARHLRTQPGAKYRIDDHVRPGQIRAPGSGIFFKRGIAHQCPG